LYYESFRTDDVITPERKLQVHNAWVQYSEDKAGVQVDYSGLKPFDITLGGGVTVRRDSGATLISFGPKQPPRQNLLLSSSSRSKRNSKGRSRRAFWLLTDCRELSACQSYKPMCL
jgi:hypothetical protein